MARHGRNNEGSDYRYPAGRGNLLLDVFGLTRDAQLIGDPYTLVCELWVEAQARSWDGTGPYLTVLARQGGTRTFLRAVKTRGESGQHARCPTAASGSDTDCIVIRAGEGQQVMSIHEGYASQAGGGSPGVPFDTEARRIEVRTQVALTTCSTTSSSCRQKNRPVRTAGFSDLIAELSVTPIDVLGRRCGTPKAHRIATRVSADAHHASIIDAISVPANGPSCTRVMASVRLATAAGDPVEVNRTSYVIRRVA